MKVLQISHKIPYPPLDGGSIVIHSLTAGLLALGHEVKMLSIISPKRKIALDDIDQEYKKSVDLITVEVDTRLRPLAALKNLLFQQESYHTSRFESALFSKTLVESLKKEDFDVIQLESIFVLRYVHQIKKYSNAKIVLRTQNIEHVIWEDLIQNESNPMKKGYLKILAKRLKAYELKEMHAVDGIIPITDYDANYLLKQDVHVRQLSPIPFGIAIKRKLPETSFSTKVENCLFHLGSMDWRPNLEGVDWFLDNVWSDPVLREKTHLYLAGKFMPKRIQSSKINKITVDGKIDFPFKYMADKKIMIVPLLSGSGIRVKIIEGMALGKVIISTTKGANGINYIPDKHLLIADTPQAFQRAIIKCLADEEFCNMISRNAKQLAFEEYDQILIAEKFIHFYEGLMA